MKRPIKELDVQLLKDMATVKERAKYLLQFEITTKVAIENLTPVAKAFIGEIGLPITGQDKNAVITAAEVWLKEQAA